MRISDPRRGKRRPGSATMSSTPTRTCSCTARLLPWLRIPGTWEIVSCMLQIQLRGWGPWWRSRSRIPRTSRASSRMSAWASSSLSLSASRATCPGSPVSARTWSWTTNSRSSKVSRCSLFGRSSRGGCWPCGPVC